MKSFASLAIGLALGAFLCACTGPNDSATLSSTADAYFFQPDLTQIYTYSQDNASQIDTFSYETTLVNPNNPYDSYLQLKNNKAASGSDVLYYFKSEQSSDGSVQCMLANAPGDKGFVALKGTLDLGATWYTDAAQNIQATVVGKYAEYFLPGRELHYNDVVVVKYSDKTAPSDTYVVRYFARNYGLIFQMTITGPNTQVADLQLLSRQGNTSAVNPDPNHGRWYNTNGRSMAHMKNANGPDK